MTNKYSPHVWLIPEDEQNLELIRGFLLPVSIKQRNVQYRPIAGGWLKAVEQIKLVKMDIYTQRHLVLVIDFDDDFPNRLSHIRKEIDSEYESRVYILGTLKEPQDLKNVCNLSLEKIGKQLAEECDSNIYDLWNHDLLKHNKSELAKLIEKVKPFIFEE